MEIKQEEIMIKLKETEIYGLLISHPKEHGEATNGTLIKLLIEKNSVIRIVQKCIAKELDIDSAIDLFKNETEKILSRYTQIGELYSRLFFTLFKILKPIEDLTQETNVAVEEVAPEEKEEVPSLTEILEQNENPETQTQIVALEKDSPETIKDFYRIRIIIQREDERSNHILTLRKIEGKLVVICKTSDSEAGKNIRLEILPGEEYLIGNLNKPKTAIQLAISKLAIELNNEKELQASLESTLNHYAEISKVLKEYKETKFKLTASKTKLAGLRAQMKKLKANPLLHWFNKKESDDISEQHISIAFEKDESVIITDEGEKCLAKVEVERTKND